MNIQVFSGFNRGKASVNEGATSRVLARYAAAIKPVRALVEDGAGDAEPTIRTWGKVPETKAIPYRRQVQSQSGREARSQPIQDAVGALRAEAARQGLDKAVFDLPKDKWHRGLCPYCQGGDKREMSFSLYHSDHLIKWRCWRANKCNHSGTIRLGGGDQPRVNLDGSEVPETCSEVTDARGQRHKVMAYSTNNGTPLSALEVSLPNLEEDAYQWFDERGISRSTVDRHGIGQIMDRQGTTWLAFPFYVQGQVHNIKYRKLRGKAFYQERDRQPVMYGVDDVTGEGSVIIVEGEFDKLALAEAGFTNVVSLPSGAMHGTGAQASREAHNMTTVNMEFLSDAKKFILAVDNDDAGRRTQQQLITQLGQQRVHVVNFPRNASGTWEAQKRHLLNPDTLHKELQRQGQDEHYRKDANEVLLKDGPDALKWYIEHSTPVLMEGLRNISHFQGRVVETLVSNSLGRVALSTGWPTLDENYRLALGDVTVVTGVPNTGKSEWLDALMLNCMRQYGWRFAVCSMENEPHMHEIKLLEKLVGKSLLGGQTLELQDQLARLRELRADREVLRDAHKYLCSHMHVIKRTGSDLPSLDWVVAQAELAVKMYNVQGLVVDPYNRLEQCVSKDMTETQFVNRLMSSLKRFATQYGCHVWVVAHPRQQKDWNGQAPNAYEISGSANWNNIADNVICVHRQQIEDLNSHSRQSREDEEEEHPDALIALKQAKIVMDNLIATSRISPEAKEALCDQLGGLLNQAERDCVDNLAETNITQIRVLKVRNKMCGQIGRVDLHYHRETGRYGCYSGSVPSLPVEIADAAESPNGQAQENQEYNAEAQEQQEYDAVAADFQTLLEQLVSEEEARLLQQLEDGGTSLQEQAAHIEAQHPQEGREFWGEEDTEVVELYDQGGGYWEEHPESV